MDVIIPTNKLLASHQNLLQVIAYLTCLVFFPFNSPKLLNHLFHIFFFKHHFPTSSIYYSDILAFCNKANMRTNALFLHMFLCFVLLGQVKADPSPLQDYCIANTKGPQSFFMNGSPCIDPDLGNSSHFTTSALSKPGDTKANQFGFNVTLTNTVNLPGFNTLGLTMARVDIAANGIVPPHSHPRASEVTLCLKGSILVGFVDTSNKQFTQQLGPGESFVFPKGLVHYLYNIDPNVPALAISGLSCQNPGTQLTSFATFTSKPPIPDEVLRKAFKITQQDVNRIRRNLGG